MVRAILAALLLALSAVPSLAQDVRGSRDHPAITRFPGSVIRWYEVQNHMAYRIATGPVTGYQKIDRWRDAAGKTTRIYYERLGDRTHAEVYANYRKALLDDGFTILAEGANPTNRPGPAIGTRTWMQVQYAANAFPPSAGVELLAGTATAGGTGFLAASKGGLFVVIGIAQQRSDRVLYLVDVIETAQVQTGLVAITAKALADGLDARGMAVLDGLFFDTDKATLRPESRPALVEIAKVLTQRSQLRVHVVGHTDMTGGFAHNMELSAARARTVVETLARDHGIARTRLEDHGVGPLSPAATNRTEAGRGQNRRVELVERP